MQAKQSQRAEAGTGEGSSPSNRRHQRLNLIAWWVVLGIALALILGTIVLAN
jgi:hypothetical protein